MKVLNQIAQSLGLKKKDENQPQSQLLKYMHGINTLSIFLFLFALLLLFIKVIVVKNG